MTKKLFISYAREDVAWLKRILPFLKTLHNLHGIEIWYDENIGPGKKWGKEIQNALETSFGAVCLISEYFLSSGFIWENELPEILKGVEQSGKIFIPVIVNNCPFKLFNCIAQFQCVNSPDTALEDLNCNEQNKIFTFTAKIIHDFYKESYKDELRTKSNV